ncbi:MAG: glycosyltransferase family 2 protein [Candidatus Levyibacteriota bacterium]
MTQSNSRTSNKIVPFDDETERKLGKGFHHKGIQYVHHSRLHPHQTAFFRLSTFQKYFLLFLLLLAACCLALNWHLSITIAVAVLIFLYFADLLFNLFLIYRSFTKRPEINVTNEELNAVGDNEWPVYTILCPLYKEWQVVPQFAKALSNMDYPKDKLQAILLLEEDDHETIKKVQELHLPPYFETVVVPDSKPKTKPKASNYGLKFARGEYTVIYDAEDVPDPLQLKKAIIAFKKAGSKVICIQAKLNFYNPHQNLLTRVFTAEYSLWFDLVLTGLQSIHAPIPLGGTSNHFHTQDLHKLKGWDSFNVTEDADLGMRLVKHGYRTAVIESITLEEANSSLKNWFGQRSRWIKGYIQTYFVHMRNPSEFIRTWNEPHYITFQLVIGGKVMSMFINPMLWLITICYFVFRAKIGSFIDSFFPAPVLYMGVISLLLGNFLYAYYYMVGCVKHGHDELVKYIFLVPFYWLAMSIAAWIAVYRFIVAPHYWSKTKHGLHLDNKKFITQTEVLQDKQTKVIRRGFKQSTSRSVIA